MHLQYVDKLSHEQNGAQYQLVGRDLIDRSLVAIGKKTKDLTETVRAFYTMMRNSTQKKTNRVIEFSNKFQNFSKLRQGKIILQ